MMDALQGLCLLIIGGTMLLTVDWLLERLERRSNERWWTARREPWTWSEPRDGEERRR
jgi:hypothetical protein